MKRVLLLITSICLVGQGHACVTCNKQVQQAIYNSQFYPNLLTMLSAFIVIGLIVAILSWLAARRYKARVGDSKEGKELASVPLTTAAAVLGIGLGGFAAGIVLHQILQWHEMLSNKLPPDTLVNKSVNMFWDGIFHAYTLLATILGVILLWQLLKRKHINRSGYLLSGGMLLGWGLFNIVEGIIDHLILCVHHVRELSSNRSAWDYGFLGFGLLLLAVGWILARRGEREARIA